MIGSMPFIKKAQPMGDNTFFRQDERTRGQRMIDGLQSRINEEKVRNRGVRESDSHPRYGFQTVLNQHSSGQLPTAPAVVGGNVMWNKSKVTPVTQQLHDSLSMGRPMNPPPALGSLLRLGEPSVNSIHTTY
jgi:hypothetical protein